MDASQKIKGMLIFLRRQNVIAKVSSCSGFTPDLYGKCPRSSLTLAQDLWFKVSSGKWKVQISFLSTSEGLLSARKPHP